MSRETSEIPKPISDTNILDLSNDCLIIIANELCPMDLFAFHKSHENFHSATEYSFATNHKTIEIKYLGDEFLIKSSKKPQCCNERYCDAMLVSNFIQLLGKYVRAITLSSESNEKITWILGLLNDCCSANLKCLSLKDVKVDETKLHQFGTLFKLLETFEVDEGLSNGGLERCLANCENLKDFSLITDEDISLRILYRINFKLEKIFYQFRCFTIDIDDGYNFLRQHPNLRSIKIAEMFYPTKDCIKYLTKLETLLIDSRMVLLDGFYDWQGLFQLQNLKHLEVILTDYLNGSLLKVKSKPTTDIETLALKSDYLEDVFQLLQIFTFENLQRLIIYYTNYGYYTDIMAEAPKPVLDFASNLIKVEELHFMNFSQEIFRHFILEFVRCAPCLQTLVLFPAPGTELEIDDMLHLAQAKQLKNSLLTVKYEYKMEALVSEVFELNESDKHEILDFLRFNDVNEEKYEFEHFNKIW